MCTTVKFNRIYHHAGYQSSHLKLSEEKKEKKMRKQIPKFSLVRNCHKNHFSNASVTLKLGHGHQIGMNVSSSINVCRWGGGRQANIKLCLKAKNM